ncbi:hypothetical protein AALO_G00275440 [Alosa alosa]|uniref:Uncharacterized protein n=1 Tax=Alosa alosa TaxID=278164 RepID=A0AAV6FMM7_9TELE|nr:uncharacterized protein LOC125287089 [Alosa alosa]KAG5262467.1 hypothetical protein AALO_G00275440 [Alosa alosa]
MEIPKNTTKKKVKKYKLEELRSELETLGVIVDEDSHKNKRKTKRELRKLLVRKLQQVDLDSARKDIHGKTIKTAEDSKEGFTLNIDIPEDVVRVIHDLDAFLNKEMEEMETKENREIDVKFMMNNLLDAVEKINGKDGKELETEERQREHDVKAILDSLRGEVDSTLGLNREEEKVKVSSPCSGDQREEKTGEEVRFWIAREDKRNPYWFIPRRRFRGVDRNSTIQETDL